MNSFYIINNKSESSELHLIQTSQDTPEIKDFSKIKLDDNDNSSDPAENNNYMCGNQVYNLTTEMEAIKMFIKEQFILKNTLPTFQTNWNNKTIKKLHNFFKSKINF